jgi:PleD family two-component response regulator
MLTTQTTTLTTQPATTTSHRRAGDTAATTAQKVVIVNGSTEILGLLETALDAGRYDVVFVESQEHAYSQIKRVQPHLVILCVRIEDRDSFQVLSMLKLDEETRRIPVLTYTTEFEGQKTDEEAAEPFENQMFSCKHAMRMN